MSIASFFALYAAGLATFLSPCVLPLLPSFLAVLGGADASRRGRLRSAGLGFAIGLSIVFVALGLGASALSHSLSAHRRLLMIAAGALMVLFGAKLVGLLRVGVLDREVRPLLTRVPSLGGFWGGLLFGAAFSLGWTPCVGPVLGAALSYAASRATSPAFAAAQLAVYALGLSTPLIIATWAMERMLGFARALRRFTAVSQRAMGGVLMLMGLLIATDRLDAVSAAIPGPSAVSALSSAQSPKPCDIPGAVACAVPRGPSVDVADVAVPVGRPHLLEFVSDHCTLCARMAPLVSELERACTRGDGTVVQASVESPAGRALAQRFGVHAVPTFLQLDSEGNEVERVVGEQTRSELELALQNVRGVACTSL